MKEAKKILDKHLMAKNTNTGHIHITAYMAALDAVNEALNMHFVSNNDEGVAACPECGSKLYSQKNDLCGNLACGRYV